MGSRVKVTADEKCDDCEYYVHYRAITEADPDDCREEEFDCKKDWECPELQRCDDNCERCDAECEDRVDCNMCPVKEGGLCRIFDSTVCLQE